MRAVSFVFGSARRLRLAQRAGRLAQRPFLRNGTLRRVPPPLSRWTTTRDLKPVAPQSFRDGGAAGDWRTHRDSRADRRRRPGSEPAAERAYRVGGSLTARAGRSLLRAGRRLPGRGSPASAASVAAAMARVCARGRPRACRSARAARELAAAGGRGDPRRGFGARELDAFDGVLTGCTIAVADTGTIILTAGAEKAGGRSHSCPTCTSASSRSGASSSSCRRRCARSHPLVRDRAPPADPHLGPVRDLGHRAQPGRRRPRPTIARRPGGLRVGAPPPSRACCPPPRSIGRARGRHGRCQAPLPRRDKFPTDSGYARAKRRQSTRIAGRTCRFRPRRPEPRPVPGTATGA